MPSCWLEAVVLLFGQTFGLAAEDVRPTLTAPTYQTVLRETLEEAHVLHRDRAAAGQVVDAHDAVTVHAVAVLGRVLALAALDRPAIVVMIREVCVLADTAVLV